MYAGKLAEKASAEEIVNAPQHPYTKLLISSLPEVGVRYAEKRLAGIAGRPPALLHPPAGCRFRDRCPLATTKCAEEPPFVDGSRRTTTVACWEVAAHDAEARARLEDVQGRCVRWWASCRLSMM